MRHAFSGSGRTEKSTPAIEAVTIVQAVSTPIPRRSVVAGLTLTVASVAVLDAEEATDTGRSVLIVPCRSMAARVLG
jgi:hypothetical protein